MSGKVNAFQVQNQNYGVEADLTFDSTPTRGSSNPVTSNGIAEAIDGARIGTDISYDRANGTPIGYCSVSYGQQNAATNNYSVAFGDRNNVYTYASIANGSGNVSLGHNGTNMAMGNSNYVNGEGCSAIGESNTIGFRIVTVDKESLTTLNPSIYIGYLFTSSGANKGKLYSDSSYQNEIVIPNCTTYIVDLTNNSSTQRTPGQIYKYYKYRSTITYEYVDNKYVRLTDFCHNISYIFRGVSYYNQSTDINYSDPARSSPIPIHQHMYPCVFFDLNTGNFLLYCGNLGTSISHPNWLAINVYRDGDYANPRRDYVQGRSAYVWTDTSKPNKMYRVYSNKDMTDSNEITNDICDGEYVIDTATGDTYSYRFDTAHKLSYTLRVDAYRLNDRYDSCVPFGNSSLVLGSSNYTSGAMGSIVAGNTNRINNRSAGSAVIGRGNEITAGVNYAGLSGIVAGATNTINTISDNEIFLTVLGNHNVVSDYTKELQDFCIIGHGNTMSTGNLTDNAIFGSHNDVDSIKSTNVIGGNNTVAYLESSLVSGVYNNVGYLYDKEFVLMTKNTNGIWTGSGITYNNGVYTFAQDKVFIKYDIPDWSDVNRNIYQNVRYILGYAIASPDGHSLIDISDPRVQDAYIYVAGSTNTYTRKYGTNNYSDYILGSYNSFVGTGSDSVGLVGSHLNVNYDDNATQINSVVYSGAYNSMDGTNGAKFVVGNGTSDEDRRNGLTVYSTGAVAAPTCPDTIAGGVNAMSNTGISSDKMLVTYGQLKDYTGPGGGGSSRPLQSIEQLISSDWVSVPVSEGSSEYTYEQSISLSGIDSNSIILTNPSGSSRIWYTSNIYLHEQSDDTLVFRCDIVPSGDVSVKVVYWV